MNKIENLIRTILFIILAIVIVVVIKKMLYTARDKTMEHLIDDPIAARKVREIANLDDEEWENIVDNWINEDRYKIIDELNERIDKIPMIQKAKFLQPFFGWLYQNNKINRIVWIEYYNWPHKIPSNVINQYPDFLKYTRTNKYQQDLNKSHLDMWGQLQYKSPCFIIQVDTLFEKEYPKTFRRASASARKLEGMGYHSGFIRSRHFKLVEIEANYLVFIGPFESYNDAERIFNTLPDDELFPEKEIIELSK